MEKRNLIILNTSTAEDVINWKVEVSPKIMAFILEGFQESRELNKPYTLEILGNKASIPSDIVQESIMMII